MNRIWVSDYSQMDHKWVTHSLHFGRLYTTRPLCNLDSVQQSIFSRVDLYTIRTCRDIRVIEVESCADDLNFIQDLFEIPKKFSYNSCNNHSQRFPWNFNINTTRIWLTQSPRLKRLPSRSYTRLWYLFEFELHRGPLVRGTPTYVTSWEE